MMKTAALISLLAAMILTGCGQTREPVEAKPPELTIGGSVSIGAGGKISAPADQAVPPSWTEDLVGASAPVIAASTVDQSGSHLERLIALEAVVAEGVKEGKFTRTDLAQVQARRARAEARLARAIGALGQAKARYNAVVGPGSN